MAYFETEAIPGLYGKYENEVISVFRNRSDFGRLYIQPTIILKTGQFRKSPKMKTDQFRLKFEIGLISALLVNEKSQGSKIPWPTSFRSSGAI